MVSSENCPGVVVVVVWGGRGSTVRHDRQVQGGQDMTSALTRSRCSPSAAEMRPL